MDRRCGVKYTDIPSPYVTHLVFLDERNTRKMDDVGRILNREGGTVQGLLAVNGSKVEVGFEIKSGVLAVTGTFRVLTNVTPRYLLQVLDRAIRCIEALSPCISFFNAGGASHEVRLLGAVCLIESLPEELA